MGLFRKKIPIETPKDKKFKYYALENEDKTFSPAVNAGAKNLFITTEIGDFSQFPGMGSPVFHEKKLKSVKKVKKYLDEINEDEIFTGDF